jgi:ribosome-associated heat shock protein Hsp15
MAMAVGELRNIGNQLRHSHDSCLENLVEITLYAGAGKRQLLPATSLPRLPMDLVRIDKWLWAVRVYQTRSLATDACKAGHVKIAGQSVKPALAVRPGDVVTAYNGHLTRTVKVLAALEDRVGAKLVGDFVEDLTPESERTRKAEPDFTRVSLVGKTKPSKKERRQLDRFKEQL